MENGLLLIHKSLAMTSHDVVQRARRLLKMKAIGHAGTLDPMASGLMVLLLGEGTKLSEYILTGDKSYCLRVRLGIETDTLDMAGKILSQDDVSMDPVVIRQKALALQGTFHWAVPMYSAVKIEGQKLYALARRNQVIVTPEKEMRFWDFSTLNVGTNFIEGTVTCSKGSYIRTWAQKLGESLGTKATLESLCRSQSHPYTLESAITLEELESWLKQGYALSNLKSAFIPFADVLPHWRSFTIKGKDERLIYNGQISYDLERRLIVEVKTATRTQKSVGIKLLSGDTGHLLSLVEAQPFKGLKIRRVFKMLAAQT